MPLGVTLRTTLKAGALVAGFCMAGPAHGAPSPSRVREAELAAAVERLIAIEDIKQLKARYYRCLDTKDWECWRTQVFTPDFAFLNANGAPQGTARGPQVMIDVITNNGIYDRVKTVHQGHMPEIEILSPTTARGIWQGDFMHTYPVGQPYQTTGREIAAPGLTNHTWTFYKETYEKIGGKWFIKTIDLSSGRLWREDYDDNDITIPQRPAPLSR